MVLLILFSGAAAGGVYLWFDQLLARTREPDNGSSIRMWVDRQRSSTMTTVPEKPDTMDILVVGSDKRAPGTDKQEGDEKWGRSDTLMLVHVDTKDDFVSVLSLPRDLRVHIPGRGYQKINAAYAIDGPRLTWATVEELTGIRIDHYVNIDFEAFRALTTALGGVWVDVDRRYYDKHLAYENLDIMAGYQRLMGEQALDYVRFRHDLNSDWGRIDRQHRFLRAAKEQFSKWNLLRKLPTLVDVVTANVKMDLSTADVLKLAYWGARLGSGRIKQVKLEATDTPVEEGAYVLASKRAVARAVEDLITPPGEGKTDGEVSPSVTTAPASTSSGVSSAGSTTPTTAPRPAAPATVDLADLTIDIVNGNGFDKQAARTARWLEGLGVSVRRIRDASTHDVVLSYVSYPPKRKEEAARLARVIGTARLEEDSSRRVTTLVLGGDFVMTPPPNAAGRAYGIPHVNEWRALASMRPFRLMAPGYLPSGLIYKDRRMYDIEVGDGKSYPALKMIYQLRGEDQYLGIMETTFLDAPAAADGEAVAWNGTIFTLVWAGDRLDHIWWKRDGVLYWISNTLGYLVSGEDLLTMAKSMTVVG